MTQAASSMSCCSTASIVRSSESLAISKPPMAWFSSCASCSRNAWRVSRAMGSAELARHVLLHAPVVGRGEDLLGRRVLDQLAAQHERRAVGHARGLLHVVRDDDDRVALLELRDQLLDLQRRDRVECGGRLVHQHDLWLDGDRARDAQTLLLAA